MEEGRKGGRGENELGWVVSMFYSCVYLPGQRSGCGGAGGGRVGGGGESAAAAPAHRHGGTLEARQGGWESLSHPPSAATGREREGRREKGGRKDRDMGRGLKQRAGTRLLTSLRFNWTVHLTHSWLMVSRCARLGAFVFKF